MKLGCGRIFGRQKQYQGHFALGFLEGSVACSELGSHPHPAFSSLGFCFSILTSSALFHCFRCSNLVLCFVSDGASTVCTQPWLPPPPRFSCCSHCCPQPLCLTLRTRSCSSSASTAMAACSFAGGRDTQPATAWKSCPATQKPHAPSMVCSTHTPSAELMLTEHLGFLWNTIPVFCFSISLFSLLSFLSHFSKNTDSFF